MKQVTLRPVLGIHDADGSAMPGRLVDLLVEVHERGSIQLAALQLGLSYRHAWDLVRTGETFFGAPLVHMTRGKGSTLTELGTRIVWAERRAVARLRPMLDSLSSELAQELRAALSDAPAALTIHASHGFAIERLIQHLSDAGLRIAFTYASGTAAAAALREGACDLAGLHVPLGPMQAPVLAHYEAAFKGLDLAVIDIARRRQGLIVRPGNPKELYTVAHLAREGVRFVNRQPGSGTRLLLEGLLAEAGVDPARVAGFENVEDTHAAVAACVASGAADVGFGLETPARHFRLDFVPIASERYFLVCRRERVGTPAVSAVIDALRSPVLRASLAELPGYDPGAAGEVTPFGKAFAAAESPAGMQAATRAGSPGVTGATP